MNRMDGKTCLVANATRGLGTAISGRLVAAGDAGIVVTGRSPRRELSGIGRLRDHDECNYEF